MIKRMAVTSALMVVLAAGGALAQSTGASPADPNNERNQRPAPSNPGPADPAADSNPGARIPTAPEDRAAASREEGGEAGIGAGAGEGGVYEPAPAPYHND